jgi:hypothetical protein
MLVEKVGLGLGDLGDAARRATAARETGARLARVSLTLGGRQAVDTEWLADATAALQALRDAGLAVIAAVGSDVTVAPSGLGAFDEPATGPLAEAWLEEFGANLAALAAGLGHLVATWEVLPRPDATDGPRIAPERFARLVDAAAAAIRSGTPEARVISGGIACDDDGQAYLAAVCRVWRERDHVPVASVGVRLVSLADGGHSEEVVAGTVRECTQRALATLRAAGFAELGLSITDLAWDAARVGEGAQARNLWAAYDALIGDPTVDAIVWRGLVDTDSAAVGLHRGPSPVEVARRDAWKAFRDFTIYARQISPPATLASLLGEPGEPAAPTLSTPPAATPSSIEPAATPASPPPLPPAASAGATAAAPEPAAAPAADRIAPSGPLETVTFRIPAVSDLLRAEGIVGDRLDAALESLAARYGPPEMLGPGEYSIAVPAGPRPGPAHAFAHLTNQDVLTALYRAGGGQWDLLERTGLRLRDLASRRNDPYVGPSVQALPGLTPEELDAATRELAALER